MESLERVGLGTCRVVGVVGMNKRKGAQGAQGRWRLRAVCSGWIRKVGEGV